MVNAVLLAVAVVDWLLAPAPGRGSASTGCSRRRRRCGPTPSLAWRIANPTARRRGSASPTSWRRRCAPPSGGRRDAGSRRCRSIGPDDHPAGAPRPVRHRRARRAHRRAARAGRPAARRGGHRAGCASTRSFRSREEAELRINKARILEVGLRSAQGRGGGTEFDQLRESRPDDEFRRIDWSATARTGKPIVRTYRAERNQTVIVLLDNGRVMAGQVAGVPRVEHAMDAAMCSPPSPPGSATAAGWWRSTPRCGRWCRRPGTRNQLGRVTEAMYDLEPVLAESDYRGAFTETLARFRRRARCSWCSPTWSSRPPASTCCPPCR